MEGEGDDADELEEDDEPVEEVEAMRGVLKGVLGSGKRRALSDGGDGGEQGNAAPDEILFEFLGGIRWHESRGWGNAPSL